MRQKVIILLFFAALLTTPVVFADPVTYTLDPAHTSFDFTVQHMMISNVPGGFDKFSGTVTYDPKDLDHSSANITIDTASIDTHIDKRDNHLRSPDFFDAAQFPNITFVSTKFTPGYISGKLTMHGVMNYVTIPVTINGPVSMMGHQAIGITGSLTINRQDYGIKWNKSLDQGGVAVSDNVNITISIEADAK